MDDRINRLAVDHQGNLWIATDRGVMERRDGRFHLRGLLGQHVYVVGTVGERVYASTGSDLALWNGRDFQVIEDHPGRRVQDLAPGLRRDEILSATAEGLALADGSGDWELLTSGPDGLPDDWATAAAVWDEALVVGTYNSGLAMIRDGDVEILAENLWVNAGALFARRGLVAAGTLDGGLWFHDGAASRTMTTADGLLDDDVTDVLYDGDGGLWVATRGGLSRLRIAAQSVATTSNAPR